MNRRRFMVFDGTSTEYAARQRRGIREFQERILAVWDVSAGESEEPDWAERLVRANDADRVFRHARHSRYASHAFFVKRLSLWQDIDVHWERRRETVAAIAASHGSARYEAPCCAWVRVSLFRSERFKRCPPEAVLTIDALDSILPAR